MTENLTAPAHVAVTGLSKRFGASTVLDSIDLAEIAMIRDRQHMILDGRLEHAVRPGVGIDPIGHIRLDVAVSVAGDVILGAVELGEHRYREGDLEAYPPGWEKDPDLPEESVPA